MKFSILFKLFLVVLLGTYIGLVCNLNRKIFYIVLTSTSFFFLCALFLNLFYRRYSVYRITWLPSFVFFMLFGGLSILYAILSRPETKTNYFDKINGDILTIKVSSIPIYRNQYQRFEADVISVFDGVTLRRSVGKAMVNIRNIDSLNLLNIGDCIQFKRKVHQIKSPLNPYEFNYKSYLQRKGIYALFYLEKGDYKHVSLESFLGDFYIFLRTFQLIGVEKLKIHIKNHENVGVLSALLLGGKWELTPETISTYSNAGVSHILAVSGMHVSLLMGIIGYCFFYFNKTRTQKVIVSIFSSLFIILYAIVTGFSAPVNRAVGMILLVIVGKIIRRDSDMLNTLSIVGILTLFISPHTLLDIGFQFSFLAMLGLLILYPVLYAEIQVKRSFCRKVWSTVAVSISAQMATLPLILYYFGQVPCYFVLANLFVIIPISLIMVVGLLFLVCPSGLFSSLIGEILDLFIDVLNNGLRFIEQLPAATFRFPKMIPLFYCFIALGVVFICVYFHIKKKIYIKFILIFLLGASSMYLTTLYKNYNISGIRVFNVGRNYALGLFHKSKAILLTDLDSTSSQMKYKVQPYFTAKDFGLLGCYNIIDNVSFTSYKRLPYSHQFKDYRFVFIDNFFNEKNRIKGLNMADLVYVIDNVFPTGELVSSLSNNSIVVLRTGLDSNVVEEWCKRANERGLHLVDLNKSPSFEILL